MLRGSQELSEEVPTLCVALVIILTLWLLLYKLEICPAVLLEKNGKLKVLLCLSPNLYKYYGAHRLQSTTGVTTAHSDTTFHPLAMLKHEILSHDDGLSLPKVNSMVFLKGIIYLRDTSGSTRGQILSYSVMERSWDTYISTPGEAVRGYHLAVWASSLVLVGGYVELKTCHWQKTFKVWVRQGNEWNADIIPPVQIHENDEILSVAGYDHHLFVLCKQPYSNFSPLQNICVLYYCDDVSTKQWQVLKGPSIIVEYHQRVSILVHDTTVVYAMIYSESSYYKAFFRGHIIMDNMTLCDIEWEQLHVIGGDITGRAYLTVFGGNVVIAELGREVKLYTPFKDTLVDIDELNLQLLYCACGIIGISDGSLIVIDDVEVDSDTLKSAVVQFKSEGTAIKVITGVNGNYRMQRARPCSYG